MFDVLDILVRTLNTEGFEAGPQSAFGESVERRFSLGGVVIAHLTPLSRHQHDLLRDEDPAGWSLLVCAPYAQLAAQDHKMWQAFLEGIGRVLRVHPEWRVLAEADCDQHPVQHLRLSVDEVIARIVRQRVDRTSTLAFFASPVR